MEIVSGGGAIVNYDPNVTLLNNSFPFKSERTNAISVPKERKCGESDFIFKRSYHESMDSHQENIHHKDSMTIELSNTKNIMPNHEPSISNYNKINNILNSSKPQKDLSRIMNHKTNNKELIFSSERKQLPKIKFRLPELKPFLKSSSEKKDPFAASFGRK